MSGDPNTEKDDTEKKEQAKPSERQMPQCTCIQDPFADLPPELKPRRKTWMSSFRKVTCPGCGFQYWTNRKTDLCVDCEKKGIKLPEVDENAGG